MSDDLVKRVAIAIDNAICDGDQSSVAMELTSEEIKVLARAAIAVVLDEAADYCEMKAKHYWGDGRDCCDAALQQTAAAIRALVKEPQP